MVQSFGLYPSNEILFFIFQRTNQVDALLDGTNGRDLVVNLHGPVLTSLAGVLARLILDWSIKELALRLVDLLICTTMQHVKVWLPAIG